MASVSQLGYLGLGVSNSAEWEKFATEILGMQISERRADGSFLIRMDDRQFRFAIHPGGIDDLSYVGWEVADRETLSEVAAQVRAAGSEVVPGTAEEARARHVLELLKFRDPNGVASEIVYGPRLRDDAFISPRKVSGFFTRDQGLGHFILFVDDVEQSLNFYVKALGFRITDYITFKLGDVAEPAKVPFLHCNPRHHSLALVTRPPGAKRLNHFMVEANSIDDVGVTWDLCNARKVPIAGSLGRHTNDQMFSFYMGSPSGFMIEYGWGGRQVDDATWKVEMYTAPSIWGHSGLAGRPRASS